MTEAHKSVENIQEETRFSLSESVTKLMRGVGPEEVFGEALPVQTIEYYVPDRFARAPTREQAGIEKKVSRTLASALAIDTAAAFKNRPLDETILSDIKSDRITEIDPDSRHPRPLWILINDVVNETSRVIHEVVHTPEAAFHLNTCIEALQPYMRSEPEVIKRNVEHLLSSQLGTPAMEVEKYYRLLLDKYYADHHEYPDIRTFADLAESSFVLIGKLSSKDHTYRLSTRQIVQDTIWQKHDPKHYERRGSKTVMKRETLFDIAALDAKTQRTGKAAIITGCPAFARVISEEGRGDVESGEPLTPMFNKRILDYCRAYGEGRRFELKEE